ncbi:MAG TPA: hypothetical protein VGI28_17645 [Stellaceae bacterium]|jgi:hypothetical protein
MSHLILGVLIFFAYCKVADMYDEWRERRHQPLRDDERFRERVDRLSDEAAGKYGIEWP